MEHVSNAAEEAEQNMDALRTEIHDLSQELESQSELEVTRVATLVISLAFRSASSPTESKPLLPRSTLQVPVNPEHHIHHTRMRV
jgi:hypothetical protein